MRTRGADSVSNARIRARTATRLAWSLWVVCVALISLALLLQFITHDIMLNWPQERLGPGLAVLTGVLSLSFPTVGALIIARLPTNPVAWISTWVGFAGPILAGVILMLVFPDGRLPSRPWRIVMWTAVLGAALRVLADAFTPGPLRTHLYVENPFGVAAGIGGGFTTYDLFPAATVLGMTLLLASSIAALVSLILRLHRARRDERQQLKWFLFAAVPATVCLNLILFNSVVDVYTMNFTFNEVWILPGDAFDYILYAAVFALLVVPVFTYIAILRYHLYDIDRLINRTLVYGTLTACVVGTYVLAVVGLGVLFQARGNLAISLLVTGLVAVLFQPLRSRLQRSVNRLMYGERDDPSAETSRLGRRIEVTLAPEAVLPTVVETIAQALKLPYAAILLKEGEGFRSAAAYGS